MKALIKYKTGKGNMEIRNVPEPSPGKGQVKIAVKFAGICGSDIHIYDSDIDIPMNPPVITGHEFSGIITELGEGVTSWKIGDRVTAETTFKTCGSCRYCLTGSYNLCLEREGIAYWHNGAFATYIVIPEEKVHILPASVSLEEGALTEPLACVVNGVMEVVDIKSGDNVLVSGPGTIGVLAAQVARTEGGIVTISGTSQDKGRLEVAKKLGADHVLITDGDKEKLQGKVANITGGEGFDVILECSGASPATKFGLEVVRRKGQYSQIGLFGSPIEIDFEQISYKELTVRGSFSQKWSCWDRALRLLKAGKIQLKPLITDIFPVTEWEKAFVKFRKKECLKILLTPIYEL